MKFIVAATIVLSFVALGCTAELRGNHHRALQTLKVLEVNPANQHRYAVYEEATEQTAKKADTYAKALTEQCAQPGHLVTITDVEENNYVSALFLKQLAGKDSWTGLTVAANTDVFKWDNGEAFSYAPWNGGTAPTAASILVDSCGVLLADKTWTVEPCDNIANVHSFVVEYDCTEPTCNWFTGIFQFLIGWLLGLFNITICHFL